MKKIVFISDLHLGDERFREAPFLDFLDRYVSKEASHLIIAGDLFELIQQNTEDVLTRGRQTIGRIWHLAETMKITYVVGNHDLYLAKFPFQWQNINLSYPTLKLQCGPYQIHVEHGHLHQEEYKRAPGLYNDLAKLGGFLNLFDPELKNTVSHGVTAIEKMRHSFSLANRDLSMKNLDEFQQTAQEIIARGANFVVFGHTHEPQEVALGDSQKYINVGDWVEHTTFGELDPATGDFLLRDW